MDAFSMAFLPGEAQRALDNTTKFTGMAGLYAKARPDYASACIDWLYGKAGMKPGCVVADIGSGTGIFAKALLEKGSTVYAVEPNADMRREAERFLSGYPNFHSVGGTAENTTLKSNSVDFITAAQAFHWFDAVGFKTECRRIIKSGGKAVLIWNARVASSEQVKENAVICKKHCPAFKGFSGRLDQIQADIGRFFDIGFEVKRFTNDLLFDKTKFVERNLSASYSPKKTDSGYAAYITELEELFDRYADAGILTMPNETVAYLGEI